MATSSGCAAALVAGLLAVGCGFDADPIVAVLKEPVGPIPLEIPPDLLTGDDTEFEWQLVEIPAASAATLMTEGSNSAVLTADVLGTYVVDRWILVGTAETWTHRFYVVSVSQAPWPIITGPLQAAPGETITLDGRGSEDPEGAPLVFQWRLVARPQASAAALADTTGPTLELVPDVRGSYELELEVFDGEIWSEEPAAHTVTVNDPTASSRGPAR